MRELALSAAVTGSAFIVSEKVINSALIALGQGEWRHLRQGSASFLLCALVASGVVGLIAIIVAVRDYAFCVTAPVSFQTKINPTDHLYVSPEDKK